ncbi:MAG: 5'-methylthioadenosine phosphorylase [bacterium]|jgi:5'-methylthioadenosine phosphorylase
MKYGIIGGSGLYDIEGLTDIQEVEVDTPFGKPSDKFIQGKLEGQDVIFLPRHGKGHQILPGEINFRANIYGMKSLGVTHLISVSAVGSLKEEIAPGHIVIPDQFIDRTKDRPSTFFGNGVVAHVQFGNPVCSDLIQAISKAAEKVGATHHTGGTYICMEGPAFSTKAESKLYRSWGADIIGMTNIQEAKLAREAELCFATIALSTDYDCWHESEEEVTVEAVLAVMAKNIQTSKEILRELLKSHKANEECPDQSNLKYALVTNKDMIPDETKKNLDVIIGKYL